jgi:Transposase IS4
MRFSDQPQTRPVDMSSEEYRWKLVDDFVQNFNDYRATTFSPSERICVDESISRWYGQGGYWINHGLPQYVAIDRKPENGCEIQNSACGDSGVMLRLKLVKTVEAEELSTNEDEIGIPHGAKVLRNIVKPWLRSQRIVCTDSYFASVKAARLMRQLGLRFIGVVKTATKEFPMSYLSGLELNNRGDRKAVVAQDEFGRYLASVWMGRERRYFIATAESMAHGKPCNLQYNSLRKMLILKELYWRFPNQRQQRRILLPAAQ